MKRNEFVDYVASFNPNYIDGFAEDLIRQARRIQKQEEDESNKTEDAKHSVQDGGALQSS